MEEEHENNEQTNKGKRKLWKKNPSCKIPYSTKRRMKKKGLLSSSEEDEDHGDENEMEIDDDTPSGSHQYAEQNQIEAHGGNDNFHEDVQRNLVRQEESEEEILIEKEKRETLASLRGREIEGSENEEENEEDSNDDSDSGDEHNEGEEKDQQEEENQEEEKEDQRTLGQWEVSDVNTEEDMRKSREENEKERIIDWDKLFREQKLYEGSSILLMEVVVMLMNIYFDHKMTKALLIDLVAFICFILPAKHSFPKSVYSLFKYIMEFTPEFAVDKHYFRGESKENLEYIGKDPKKEHYTGCFYDLDIGNQIENLLKKRRIVENFIQPNLENSRIRGDVTTGAEYKRINYDRQGFDVSLMVNTDGLQLWKSSKYHCWPIMAKILELPLHIRDHCVILCGLWCSKIKPNMQIFFKPLCDKLKKLFREGIKWKNPLTRSTEVSRVTVPIVVGDGPARAELQLIQYPNGRFGCNSCEIKTQKIPATGRQKKAPRVYAFVKIKDLVLRSKKRMKRQAELLKELKNQKIITKEKKIKKITHVKGVKGKSIIMTVPRIDVSKAFVAEFMHSFLLRIGGRMMEYLFEKPGPWSLKEFTADVDGLLNKIKPPCSFPRYPRSVTERKLFKATEFHDFLMYYSIPVLKGFFTEDYFQHWLSLIITLNMALQPEMDLDKDLELLQFLVEDFVQNFEFFYEKKGLTNNIHQLLHIPSYIENFGMLWASSAFIFEHLNGWLANITHGSKYPAEEIIKNIKITRGVEVLKEILGEMKNDENPTPDNVCLLGSSKPANVFLKDEEKAFLREHIGDSLDDVTIFKRAKINGNIFTCKLYKTDIRTNSYTVQMKTQNVNTYGEIDFFIQIRNDIFLVVTELKVENTKILVHQKATEKFNRAVCVKHILPVKVSGRKKIVKSNDIEELNHLIRIQNFVCKQPNHFKAVM